MPKKKLPKSHSNEQGNLQQPAEDSAPALPLRTNPNNATQLAHAQCSSPLYPPMTWYEGGTYSSPCTAGGDLDLPDRLPVNEAVLNQTDKSLNKQLWALYPVELSSEAAMEQGAALHLSALESFDPACVPLDELSRRLGWQAADQRLQMMILDNITLEDLEAVGVYNCGPKSRRHSNFVNQLKKGVSLLLAMPKKLHHVVSVEEALAKVNSMMDDRHQSEAAKTLQPPLIWGLELRAVLSDLLELAPWHPFPDVMTAEQAFVTGLAQMYTGLLYECALLSYRLGHYHCRLWLRSIQFSALLIETRYITHRQLIMAVKLHHVAHVAITSGGHDGHLPDIDRAPRPDLVATRDLIKRMEAKATKPDAWAHENCLTAAHEGCM